MNHSSSHKLACKVYIHIKAMSLQLISVGFDSALSVVGRIFTNLFSPMSLGSSAFSTLLTIMMLAIFLIREYLMYNNKLPQKYAIEYIFLILMICLFGTSGDQFVYFQF